MIVFYGSNTECFPIIKKNNDNAWLCQLCSGSIHALIDFQEYDIRKESDTDVFFVINEGMLFRILGGTKDVEFRVFPVEYDMLVTIYPYMGSNANTGYFSTDFPLSSKMSTSIQQMLSLEFQQLALIYRSQNLLEKEKMLLHLFIHIYLTFYNGIGKVECKSSTQSFELINRFYEMFSEQESYRHRDTQYFADKLNITTRYLFQICKDETGRTPKELINDTIISEIRHTMLSTNLSFQQLSIMFNFPDQTAFTQFFKRNTGMTPTEFKQRYK